MVILGAAGTAGFTILGIAMLNFRAVFEPMLRVVLPYFVARLGGYYRYDPARYEFWAWMPVILALLWLALCITALVKKPADDRRIDRALRNRPKDTARGAPLEPD